MPIVTHGSLPWNQAFIDVPIKSPMENYHGDKAFKTKGAMILLIFSHQGFDTMLRNVSFSRSY